MSGAVRAWWARSRALRVVEGMVRNFGAAMDETWPRGSVGLRRRMEWLAFVAIVPWLLPGIRLACVLGGHNHGHLGRCIYCSERATIPPARLT